MPGSVLRSTVETCPRVGHSHPRSRRGVSRLTLPGAMSSPQARRWFARATTPPESRFTPIDDRRAACSPSSTGVAGTSHGSCLVALGASRPVQVPVQLTFRGMAPSEALATHVRLRLEKLERICDAIVSCHVVVQLAGHHHRHGDRFHISISIRLPGHDLLVGHAPPRRLPPKRPKQRSTERSTMPRGSSRTGCSVGAASATMNTDQSRPVSSVGIAVPVHRRSHKCIQVSGLTPASGPSVCVSKSRAGERGVRGLGAAWSPLQVSPLCRTTTPSKQRLAPSNRHAHCSWARQEAMSAPQRVARNTGAYR